MATTKSNARSLVTELIVNKSDFKNILQERIILGEEIYNKPIITEQDISIVTSKYDAWTDYNKELLKQSFNNPFNEYRTAYIDVIHSWNNNIDPAFHERGILRMEIENLRKLLAKVDLLRFSTSPQLNQTEVAKNSLNISKNEVFIVHGLDEEAKIKTARFIEQLGLKPIILHEQASSGRTIIEKIEEYSNVGFGIVLYTPCDLGTKQNDKENLKARARQNVVFEHGYFIGKIGRNNVCALVKGDIEKPNDISGVVYINMDTENAWHFKIAKELKNSGYNIDLNRII